MLGSVRDRTVAEGLRRPDDERTTMNRRDMHLAAVGRRWSIGAARALVFTLLVFLIPAEASAAGVLVAPTSRYAGMTYGQWGAAWWRWALEIPASVSPITDPTGARCATGQAGPVWFLAGTNGSGTADRTCAVPAGKALFFPIVNAFAAEPTGTETYDQLLSEMRSFIDLDDATTAAAVDGNPLNVGPAYRAVSPPPPFSFVLPQDNLFGDPTLAGPYDAVSDGYWVMVAPLSRGRHTISFHGTAPLLPSGTLDVSVTYHLIIR
jgi:hypothetical protein